MAETPVQTSPSGLPPVAPPSARFILQLFLVPFLIVGAFVFVYLCWSWIFGSPHSPEKFLRDLNDSNLEVRWRAAEDLAQVLPRDAALASNTHFALGLADHLRRALDDNRVSEKVRTEQQAASGKQSTAISKALEAERDLISYLIACVGNFQIPVGAPILETIALDDKGSDAETVFRRRAQAVFALKVLGNNIKKFQRQPASRREQIFSDLKEESATRGERGRWAAAALAYLEGKPGVLTVAETLCKVAHDPAPFLRKQAAWALTDWDGSNVEETLLALTRDDGSGEDPIAWEKDQEDYRRSHPEEVKQQNGRDIRYNAAMTLARRGSAHSIHLSDLYKEMLDEEKQLELARSDAPQESSAEDRAVRTILATLNALYQLVESGQKLPWLPDALEPLVESKNKSISNAAKELQTKVK